MISIAITNFNRTDLVIDSFTDVLNNENISEIIISDDCSDINQYNILKELLEKMKSDKIKIYRNEKNMKPFLNKYHAVKRCSNDWVILLDSDNKIKENYINMILSLDRKDDVVYVPEKLLRMDGSIGWNYNQFSNEYFDINKVRNMLGNGNFETFLNTGNFFVNRKKYVDAIENENIDENMSTNDAIYFSYVWLKNNNKMYIVPNLVYNHRVHGGSWYMNNTAECERNTKIIKERIIKSC